ncbi:MAG: hypothetical protein ABFC62_12515 [Clostridiaceae bacterium]|nr:hypothetical protein [Eubacteriales bacterium]
MRIVILALCVLLLAGCSNSANTPQMSLPPEAAAAYTPDVSFVQDITSLEDSPPITPDNDTNVLLADRVIVPQDQEPFFLRGTKLSLTFQPEAEGLLTGNRLTYAQIEILGETLAAKSLGELQAILENIGVEMEQSFPCEFTVNDVQCINVMDGNYIRMYITTYNSNEAVNLFFRKEGDFFMPCSYVCYEATDGDSQTSFLEFADQEWMLYHVYGGGGTGYIEDWMVWYNLTACRNEIGYLNRYHNEGNVAPSVYERQDIYILSANVTDAEESGILELSVHMQLEAEYWPDEENIENAVSIPKPDKIVTQTQVQLYYDKAADGFYIRTLPEAYPLCLNYDRSRWLNYVGDTIYNLFHTGNDYQKQWATLFYK